MTSVDKNQVSFDLVANVDGFKRGTAEAEAALKSLSRSFNEPSAALDAVAKKSDVATAAFSRMGLAIGAANALTAREMLQFGKRVIDTADALNDMSTRTGVSIKELAGLKLIAEQSGTSLDIVARGLQRLNITMGEAQNGSKAATAALQRLGVTARDPQEAFYQLADAVKASNDPTRIAADLQKVFGRGAAELIPLLKEGGDGLRRAAQESESFADAMARLAPNADQFNDNMAKLKENTAGAAAAVLNELVPALNQLFERFERLNRLRSSGASLMEIITGEVSANTGASLQRVNAEVLDLEATIARLHRNSGGKDQSIIPLTKELARLKALRAELQEMEVERLNVPPPSKSSPSRQTPAPSAGSLSLPAAGRNGRSLDKDALWADQMASGLKEANAELERYAEDMRFVERADMERSNAINAQKQAWVEAGRALEDAMRTPQERATTTFAYLDYMLDEGLISWETYSRKVLEVQDEIDASLRDTTDKSKDAFADLKRSVEGFGKDAANAFADWAMGAEASIGDVAQAWAREMVSMMAYKQLFEPMANAAGDIIGSVFSAIFSAKGNAFEGATGMAAYRNTVVDRPTIVPLARGAAVIGEKPGSVGEAVMPLTRMRDGDLGVKVGGGGGATVIVQLIESPGNGGKTEQRQDGNGNNILEVYVEKIKGSIAGDISAGRGAIPNALAGTYGLNRVPGAY